MNETARTCVRGCRAWSKHATDCPGIIDDQECRGCQPRTADHGNLCWPCHRRLDQWLANGPNSLAYADQWLTANLSGYRPGGGSKADGNPPKPSGERSPISEAIFDCRQLLRDRLSGWLETHVADRHLSGPDAFTVPNACSYLAQWQDKLEDSAWVGDMWEELAEVMRDAHLIAPWRAEVRRCEGVPCPRCENKTLVIFGGEVDVTCRSCWWIYTRKDYDRWVWLLADENREGA